MTERHVRHLTAHDTFTRDHIVAAARSWIGTPYHHQASLRCVGTDCLGLVRGVWRHLYGEEPEQPPPYTSDWSEASATEPLLTAARRHLAEVAQISAQRGDVLLFRLRPGYPVKHAAILSENGRMVHAVEGATVAEVPIAHWWRRRVAAAFSFPCVASM